MDIDVILDARADADETAVLGALAERHGLGAVWTSSLLDSRDPFTNMSVLARNSDRIRMGPIAVNPFDIHPVRIATSLYTLNELCDGRAQIVIGGGGEALEAIGIKPERRVRAVRECVEILKRSSPDHPLTYDGELYRVNGYHPRWAKAPSPNIYIGANMKMMLTMAAMSADGIMLSDLTPDLVRKQAAFVKERQKAADRAPRNFMLNNFFAWHVYENQDKAVKEARQWLPLRGLFRRWVITTFLSAADYDVIESHRYDFFNALAAQSADITGVPARILDALVDNLTLTGNIGSIASIIDRLKAFKAAGLNAISLRLYRDAAQSIKLIGEEVAPVLR